jgi:hypothetical protein
MATHHSKTRRAKGSHDKIVVPSWESIWASFNAENEKTTIESMNVEGWKTIVQASKSCGLSSSRVNQMANEGKMDRIKKRVWCGGLTREINFVRPKLANQ